MLEIAYITGNNLKFLEAKEGFKSSEISLLQVDIETPEIQSDSSEEVAKYSAKWAAEELNKPVLLSDYGFYIKGLNGFPGPLMKFVNKWFKPEDFISLLENKENREVEVMFTLAFCEPGSEPVCFSSSVSGTVSERVGAGSGHAFDFVFIPEGYDKVASEIGKEEMTKFWGKSFDSWKKMTEFLLQKYK